MSSEMLARCARTICLLFAGLLLLCSCNQKQEPEGPIDERPDPKFTASGPVLPDAPPSDTLCTQDNWCWLHPRPSSHNLMDMQQVGDRINAVGIVGGVRWLEPLVLGDGVESVPIRIPDDEAMELITTSNAGWLALTENGTVYEFDGDELLGSVEVDGPNLPRYITGTSLENFVIVEDRQAWGFRNGSRVQYEDIPDFNEGTVFFWENGDVWEVGPTKEHGSRPDDAAWKTFPSPIFDGNYSATVRAAGPSPASQCADLGVYAAGPTGLRHWETEEENWRKAKGEDPFPRQIACSHQAELISLGREGRLGVLRDQEWRKFPLNTFELDDAAALDSRTLIAGPVGYLAEYTGETVNSLNGGMFPVEAMEANPQGPFFSDVWLSDDGSRGVFAGPGAFYHGSAQGDWQRPDQEDLSVRGFSYRDQVWGIDSPEFAISSGQLFKWSGSRWRLTELGELEGGAKPIKLIGQDEDDVWLLQAKSVMHYEGSTWSEVYADDSEERSFTDMILASDRTLLVSTEGTVYELAGDPGSRSLQKRTETPCETVHAMHETAGGALFVAGGDLCVASLTDNQWTEYSGSFERNTGFNLVFRTMNFTGQPGTDRPVLATPYGLLEPTESGELVRRFAGELVDAQYLPSRNVTVLAHKNAIIAKYH